MIWRSFATWLLVVVFYIYSPAHLEMQMRSPWGELSAFEWTQSIFFVMLLTTWPININGRM